MINAFNMFSLALVWLGGAAFGLSYFNTPYTGFLCWALTALGSGFLGIMWATMTRINQDLSRRVNAQVQQSAR